MSFSEYNGSKAKVSQAVGRILRNAQENLPKIQGSPVSAFLKSIGNGRSGNGSERLNKPNSPPTQPSRKFRFQKVKLSGSEKQKQQRQHAELLVNQDVGDDNDSEEEMESHLSLIGPPTASPHKQKRWPF